MKIENEAQKPLVSIITPMYNSEFVIADTIESVLEQTYSNWEFIIVDDLSTDNSLAVVKEYCNKDERIKLLSLEENSGTAIARNKAISEAKGCFIAFLDSDDLWKPKKLEKQISFMIENDYAITSTNYEQLTENNKVKRIIKTREKINYKIALKFNPIGNSTVVYDVTKLGKVEIPNIKRRNDYALWLKILRSEKYVYGINEVLASYRLRKNSISSNKVKVIKYQYYVYRKLEKLSFIKSVYLILFWIMIKLLRIK
mgnify:CR=1 FL=1